MSERKAKFVLNSMFKNEAETVLRMLESCYKYIDYWVIQDNGSTDGTQDLVQNFMNEKGIPGVLYSTEWKNFGWNRDDAFKKLQECDHDCDWVLRMDADEILEIAEDFDWSIFDNKEITAFNVPAFSPGSHFFRTWIWNTYLPWYHEGDRHEVIKLKDAPNDGSDFFPVNLPLNFRHVLVGGGQTWTNPMKFLNDALILEQSEVVGNNLLDNPYHFFYIAKSYSDNYEYENFPLGRRHSEEFARRTIFYAKEYLNVHHNYEQTGKPAFFHEEGYYSMYLIGRAYKFLKEYASAIKYFKEAEPFCDLRNEHLEGIATTYLDMGDYRRAFDVTSKILKRKTPFPNVWFLLHNSAYPDTSEWPRNYHQRAVEGLEREGKIFPEVSSEISRDQIINKIIQKFGFKTYLEVGVNNPQYCFNKIECEEKAGVDPGIDYPANPVKYKMTSDEFFESLNANKLDLHPDKKWDVIFIDGLHVSHQVQRDIENALDHLAWNGYVVIHDCNPPDSWHAREDYSKSGNNNNWCGSVWKSIYWFRTHRKDLQTIVLDTDYGVGLIRKGPSEKVPFDNNFYEYSSFEESKSMDLGLTHPSKLDEWLNSIS